MENDLTAALAALDRGRLAECLEALQSLDPKRIHLPAQTAFWVNVFNAVVVRDLPELARAGSLREAESFFERSRARVGGLPYSLDDIQHGLLRGNMPKAGRRRAPMRSDDPRLAHMPLTLDERLHFALYSGSRSSPPLRVYSAGRLDEQLEEATRQYLRREVHVREDGALVELPRQFLWYKADFGGEQDALGFALGYLEDPVVESVDRRRGRVKLRYADFDWRIESP